jgi:hypothetical protein
MDDECKMLKRRLCDSVVSFTNSSGFGLRPNNLSIVQTLYSP